MVEAADEHKEPDAKADKPRLRGVAERRQRRAETLEVLADPRWPGDGAWGPPAARSAMWWFAGVAILLAFPRQYVAAISATVLAAVFWWLQRRDQPDEAAAEAPPRSGEPQSDKPQSDEP